MTTTELPDASFEFPELPNSSDGADDHIGATMEPAEPFSLARWAKLDRRKMQVSLGSIWLIAAALQLQPKMFTSFFPTGILEPNAAGQPGFIGPSISHMANFISHDVALWNTLFALTQVAIGLGLIFRRTIRPALAISFAWAIAVWWFGEGLGRILLGNSNALMGAPGAVLLYGLIGILVWPRRGDLVNPDGPIQPTEPTGLATSVAGRGILGPMGSLAVWSSLWLFLAFLQLLPQNRTSTWLRDSIASMASGEPGWYAHFLNSTANAFTGAGTAFSVVFAVTFIAIAIGPVLSRRADLFIYLAMAIALLFWVTGQAFGGILTGTGTDVNCSPLLILLGLALLPHKLADARDPVPAQTMFARHPAWATIAVVSLAALPIAVAAVPDSPAVAAASGSGSGSTSSSGASASGGAISGSMVMAGSSHSKSTSMNMAAMAGLNVTNPKWKYTGPPLPASEVAMLTSVSATEDSGHNMQTPDCNATPTAQQVLGATQYVQATSSAVARYKVLSVALAAGYVPITSLSYPVVHFLNRAYMNNQDLMKPNTVDSLVYAFTPQGPVLVAAMYLMPGPGNGPMPYGCLVQWHQHTNLCTSLATHQIVGFTPCKPGTAHEGNTPMMTHVWQVPVAGGPLAIDPSDLQVVEAAAMAQQQGLAPVTPGYTNTFGPTSSFNPPT